MYYSNVILYIILSFYFVTASKRIFKFCIIEFETWQPHTPDYINILLYEEIKLF